MEKALIVLLLYNPYLPRLEKQIVDKFAGRQDCGVVKVTNHSDFRKRLATCISGEGIVVYSIHDEKDLLFLEEVRDILGDIKLFINVVDNLQISEKRIFRLYPRVFTAIPSDQKTYLLPDAVERTVNQIIKNSESVLPQNKTQ